MQTSKCCEVNIKMQVFWILGKILQIRMVQTTLKIFQEHVK